MNCSRVGICTQVEHNRTCYNTEGNLLGESSPYVARMQGSFFLPTTARRAPREIHVNRVLVDEHADLADLADPVGQSATPGRLADLPTATETRTRKCRSPVTDITVETPLSHPRLGNPYCPGLVYACLGADLLASRETGAKIQRTFPAGGEGGEGRGKGKVGGGWRNTCDYRCSGAPVLARRRQQGHVSQSIPRTR